MTTFQGAGVAVRGPDAGMRRGGRRGAGRAVRPGRRGRRPQPGPAVSRRAPGSHAAAGHGQPGAGAGRPAGQSLGAHLAGGSAAAGRQLGAAGRVDGAGPGPVGRAPRRRLRGRRGRRRLAGRRRRRGDRLRRGHGPDRDRRRQPWTRWTTWSGCASNWTGCAATATPAGYRQAWAAIEQAVIGKAVDLLSGPGGLASFLRRRQLGARLAGPSLPLDIGYSETIPPGIRNAVILRDQHCQWAGRCDQPAERLPGPPHQAQGQRRPDQRQGLRASLLVPPPGRDPPLGLDPGPEPRRHHHRLEQGQDQGPPQPRTPGPAGVITPGPVSPA